MGSDDVRPHETAGRPVGDELAEAGGVLERPAIGDVAVVLHGHHHVDAGVACLVLGHPDGGDLRVGEHRMGHGSVVVDARDILAEDVVCDRPGLVIGHVLELERRADVAERPHAGHRRRTRLVDHDPAVGVQRQPSGGRIDGVAVGHAPRGHQDVRALEHAAVAQGEVHPFAMAFDPVDGRAEPEIESRGERGRDGPTDVVVLGAEQLWATLDDRHK